MNVVDLRYQARVVVPQYDNVVQPMISYTSVEEFRRAIKAEGKKIILVKDASELFSKIAEIIKELKIKNADIYSSAQKNFSVTDYNLWVATGEKFVPLATNMYLETVYKVDNDGNKIPTDNTFVKVHTVKDLSNTMVCYTSSGIFNTTFRMWDFTAAIRNEFNQTTRKRMIKATYGEKLKMLLEKKKPMVRDALLFANLMNPLSSTYLDPERTIKKVYPEIRMGDRLKVLQSERFKLFFMKQLEILMPDLISGIRKHNNSEEIGIYLKAMRDKALIDGNTDDQLKALAATMKIAWGENLLQGSNPFQSEHSIDNVPYVTQGDEEVNKLALTIDSENSEEVKFKVYDDTKDKEATAGQMNDQEYEDLMEQTGAVDGYVEDNPSKPKADGAGV